MPTLTVKDAEIYYELAGEGPPLLLLAGLASDSQSWGPARPHLERRFSLVMPDNRGCGRTRDDGAPLAVAGLAADALALIDHLGIARAHVLGHSMGVAVALSLTASRPDRVGRLALAAGAAKLPARAASVITSLVSLREAGIDQNTWHRLFFHWLFAPGFFESPAAVEAAVAMSRAYPYAQSPADMRRQAEAVLGFSPAMSQPLDVPALLIAGEEDILLPPAAVRTTLELLPEARMTVLAGAGHSLHWDAPEAFAKAAGDFLAGP